MATRKDQAREAEILIWNYNDDDVPDRGASIDLVVSGLPVNAKRALVEHFRLDSSRSNAFAVWKEMGSPAAPSAGEYQRLENAGQLQPLDSPTWTTIQEGAIRLQFILPRQGLSLVRLAW
jgi:xylan 1,4-beta-xylosidase